MLWGSAIVAVLAVGAWQGYSYLASAPSRAQKVYEEGMLNMTPGRYAEAVRLFTRAVEIYPRLAVAYLERGNAQNFLGETAGALADYDKAIEAGSLAAAYTARGRLYLKRGDASLAEADFNSSIGIEPTVDAYFQLGQMREAAGDHEHAILNYDHALLIQPDSPYIYLARAQSKQGKGDEEGATADRAQAFEIEHRLRR